MPKTSNPKLQMSCFTPSGSPHQKCSISNQGRGQGGTRGKPSARCRTTAAGVNRTRVRGCPSGPNREDYALIGCHVRRDQNNV